MSKLSELPSKMRRLTLDDRVKILEEFLVGKGKYKEVYAKRKEKIGIAWFKQEFPNLSRAILDLPDLTHLEDAQQFNIFDEWKKFREIFKE